jgi:phosphate transport system permease protein
MNQTVRQNNAEFKRGLANRKLRGAVWRRFFALSTIVALLALVALFSNVANQAFGYVVAHYEVNPETIVEGGDLTALDNAALAQVLADYQPRRLRVYIRDTLSVVAAEDFTSTPISQSLAGSSYPVELADLTINDLTAEQHAAILADNLSHEQLLALVESEVTGEEEVLQTWTLTESLFERAAIEQIAAEEYPDERLYFRAWLSLDFLTNPASSIAEDAGVRTALLGSLWVIAITVAFAFPVGVGAAIYLEEYASRSRLNQIIETNIRNLAGVPSIIYGLLGLAIFVRALEGITAGRTILSAGLTMGLLILPVIIINSQEALRAVPFSIREASYGLGATRWQTIWRSVLPAAVPGILTGTILAMSRAIGETAPLIVIGAATYIAVDPEGPLAKFTALPIQIYQWTARPQADYKDIAAAAILVLLALLLTLNATAIVLRQRYRRKLSV